MENNLIPPQNFSPEQNSGATPGENFARAGSADSNLSISAPENSSSENSAANFSVNSGENAANVLPDVSLNVQVASNAPSVNWDLNSVRARRARFATNSAKTGWIIAVFLLAITLLVGALTLFAGFAFGWIILGFFAWPLMFLIYKKHELDPLSPAKNAENSRNLSDILAGDLLGRMTENISPVELARALLETNGGRFFVARFGISAQFLPEMIASDNLEIREIFAKAWEIRADLPEKTESMNSATVMAALILSSNAAKKVLSTLHLDEEDVLAGARWFSHLDRLIAEHARPKMTGGIARDWSFGYIPMLERFGVNLSQKYSGGRSLNSKLESHQEFVAQIIDHLSSGRTNAALIGPVGSGKSTIVDSFAEKLMDADEKLPANLRFNQVFALDASAILSAVNDRGQIEGLVNRLLTEAYRAKNIILFLDNAELFFENATGSVDLSNILQPLLENSPLKIILALDEQKFLQISQAKPALGAALNRLMVGAPAKNDVMKVMQDQIIALEYNFKVTYMFQSLNEAYRLSERYIQDISQPGKSVRLLEQAASKAENGLVTEKSVRDAIESTLGVKIGGEISDQNGGEREMLLNLENLIHERMINQTAAVSAVAAALRRARAGVRNENRPIGTFLFLGPTGVGKTELAKSLAAVYFGGEDNIVRVDLNEYVRAEDVARLIADGATDPNSLSAQVQKKPFSVVLLDEIEKAHDNVLTTLLQVLDEGILRDINNREISFRDAIVIATSNAGADRIRQYIDAGYRIEQFSEQIQNELIESQEFRPEFLNRFDEIVVFRPLSKDELLQVVDLILAGINKNLANQKIAISVEDEAKRALVEAGYDPRLGARPMRRIVQKTVENIVAQKMLSGELASGGELTLTLADIEANLA